MARESIVGEKSLAFGKRIARCYKYLNGKKHEGIMSKQLLRSGTSIGANVREGHYAQSKKDFVSKLNIALKEAGETDYWLDVIHSAEFLNDAILANMAFSHIDASGLHFNATLCIPDGATCYMVESTISYTGVLSMQLVEY